MHEETVKLNPSSRSCDSGTRVAEERDTTVECRRHWEDEQHVALAVSRKDADDRVCRPSSNF